MIAWNAWSKIPIKVPLYAVTIVRHSTQFLRLTQKNRVF